MSVCKICYGRAHLNKFASLIVKVVDNVTSNVKNLFTTPIDKQMYLDVGVSEEKN